jgi:hypothetical protein
MMVEVIGSAWPGLPSTVTRVLLLTLASEGGLSCGVVESTPLNRILSLTPAMEGLSCGVVESTPLYLTRILSLTPVHQAAIDGLQAPSGFVAPDAPASDLIPWYVHQQKCTLLDQS